MAGERRGVRMPTIPMRAKTAAEPQATDWKKPAKSWAKSMIGLWGQRGAEATLLKASSVGYQRMFGLGAGRPPNTNVLPRRHGVTERKLLPEECLPRIAFPVSSLPLHHLVTVAGGFFEFFPVNDFYVA